MQDERFAIFGKPCITSLCMLLDWLSKAGWHKIDFCNKCSPSFVAKIYIVSGNVIRKFTGDDKPACKFEAASVGKGYIHLTWDEIAAESDQAVDFGMGEASAAERFQSFFII